MTTRERCHRRHHVFHVALVPSPNNGCCRVGKLTNHDATTGFQHPIHFPDGDLGLVDVAQTKTDRHRIKTGGREREGLRVTLDKFDVGVSFATLCHHSWRKIQGHHCCAGLLQSPRRGSCSRPQHRGLVRLVSDPKLSRWPCARAPSFPRKATRWCGRSLSRPRRTCQQLLLAFCLNPRSSRSLEYSAKVVKSLENCALGMSSPSRTTLCE